MIYTPAASSRPKRRLLKMAETTKTIPVRRGARPARDRKAERRAERTSNDSVMDLDLIVDWAMD